MFQRIGLPLLFLSVASAAAASAAAAEFHVVARYPIGGTGSYDYIRFDAEGHRLFVAHETRFEVIDADSGRKLGEIGPSVRAHGVALAREFGHGFASCGSAKAPGANSILMFDLATLKTLRVIRSTGNNPDSIEYDGDTRRIYAVNGASGSVDAIDPASGAIVGTVRLDGGKLEQIAFDGRGRAFVNDEERSRVHVFDTRALKALADWPLSPGEGGTALIADSAHHRLFSACGNETLVVLDSDTGKIVATPAIGEDPDGAAYDPAAGLIFTSNVGGTLSILRQDSPDAYSPVQTVGTAFGARTIAYDPGTARAFVSTGEFGPAPEATAQNPHPRRRILPGTFEVLMIGR